MGSCRKAGTTVLNWLTTLVRRRRMYKQEEVLTTPLDRCLTLYHLIFYSVANMAGAGIYVLTGRLIKDEAGAAACLSYLLAAVSSAFTGLCYAEFATLIPKAGSVYVYTFLTLGELPAFIIGWTTISDILVGIASISKAFSGTINELAHQQILNWTESHVGELSHSQTGVLAPTYDFIAMGLIIIMMVITATGANISLTFNTIITGAQICCLFIIAIGCLVYGSSASWSPREGGFTPNGLYGVISGATIAVFAFSGFDSIANASEETINPKKNIPRALLGSLIIITILYFMASFGLAYLVPRSQIDYSSPFVRGFERAHVTWLIWFAAIGTLLATGAGKVTTMYIVPRIFYAIASDGLLFRCFAYVEKRSQVPIFGLIFGGTISALLALFFNIQTLAEFVSLGILFSYFTIGLDIIVMRYWLLTAPQAESQKSANETTVDTGKLVEVDGVQLDTTEGDETSGLEPTKQREMPIRERFQNLVERFPSLKTGRSFIMIVIIHVLLSFTLALIVDYIIASTSVGVWLAATIFFLLWVATIVLLSIYEPSESSETYQTPFMPMAPVMTIFINAILIARLPALTWARFAIWSIVGFTIYFAYGRRNSIANANNEYLQLNETSNVANKESYGT